MALPLSSPRGPRPEDALSLAGQDASAHLKPGCWRSPQLRDESLTVQGHISAWSSRSGNLDGKWPTLLTATHGPYGYSCTLHRTPELPDRLGQHVQGAHGASSSSQVANSPKKLCHNSGTILGIPRQCSQCAAQSLPDRRRNIHGVGRFFAQLCACIAALSTPDGADSSRLDAGLTTLTSAKGSSKLARHSTDRYGIMARSSQAAAPGQPAAGKHKFCVLARLHFRVSTYLLPSRALDLARHSDRNSHKSALHHKAPR